jgi:prophage regulatory protein
MSNVEKLLKRSEVVALTGLSRSTIDRKVRTGTFPAPLRISQRRVAWRASEVLTWLSEQRPTPRDAA